MITQEQRTNEQKAVAALEEIRKTHPTYDMGTERFKELSRAICFYLKGGFNVQQVAKLVIEEIF